MRDVTVAVPEESIADFYLLVGRWLHDLPDDAAAAGASVAPPDAAADAEAAAAGADEAPAKPRARRASRYDAIVGLVEDRGEDTIELSFDQIEVAIEAPLPGSARKHRAWWSNSEATSQARAWLGAGYRVQRVDFEEGLVTLERR